MVNNSMQSRFFKSFLAITKKEGWNINSFNKTKKKFKRNSKIINDCFPNELDDLILFFNSFINEKVSILYNKKRIKESLRLKILTSLKIRFEILNKNKDAIKKSLNYLAKPSNQILSSKLVYKIVDFTWNLIGDKSKDINFYTKRAILAAIYSSAVLIWLNDKSNKLDKTNMFLEKSIMNMNIISVLKENLKEKFSKFL